MFANVKYALHFVKYVLHFFAIFSQTGCLEAGSLCKYSVNNVLAKLRKAVLCGNFVKRPCFYSCFLGNQEINQFEFL